MMRQERSSGMTIGVMVLVLWATSLIAASSLQAQQETPLWLYLTSKSASLSETTPAHLGITERSLWRRSKVLPPDQLIDVLDLPVDEAVVRGIRSTGARIRCVSRWLNAVSVDASPAQARDLASLPRVEQITPVAVYRRRIDAPGPVSPRPSFEKGSAQSSLDYGNSFTQLNLINVIPLHDAAINGRGVIVGMLDDGYNNHRTHESTAANHVLAEYDFIQGDANTSIGPGEVSGQGDHGMYTYSALSGYREGALIGPAYGSSFLLAKTEITATETQIEEDLYVQGLEWLEQQGADVVSSSLGYIDWYTYAQLDGNTAVTTRAARIATRKGVLLVTAMGNEGWYQSGNTGPTGTMIAPADADSIISVGAVSSGYALASFSSTGPTADGRTKPEVVAQGVNVVCALPSSPTRYLVVNGTSLSTPLTAGVAALVLSAHPNLMPSEVREALVATAFQINDGTLKSATYPNNFYGHGLVDAFEAVLYHGPAFSNVPRVVEGGSTLEVYTSILSKTALPPDSLVLHYQAEPGAAFEQVRLSPTMVANQYVGSIPKGTGSFSPRGYFSAYSTLGGTITHPTGAPDSLFDFWSLLPPEPEPVSSFALFPNYPNPFNAGTRIAFQVPYTAHVDLSIYTVLGQRVVTLVNGTMIQGRTEVHWDGRDAAGAHVPSGVYFYRLSAPEGTQTKRLMILK